MQKRRNSIADALELRPFYIQPLLCALPLSGWLPDVQFFNAKET